MDAKPTLSETTIVEKLHLEPTSAVTSHCVPITSHYRKPVLLKMLARETELSMAEVQRVLNNLNIIVQRHLVHGAVSHFTLPGLFKVEKKRQTGAGAKIINPSVNTSHNCVSDPSEPYVLEFHAAKALRGSV